MESISPRKSSSDFFIVLLQALVITFVIRTFFIQPFVIPSGSMRPTLLVGDYLFVNKMAYGYSRYSFPIGFNYLPKGRLFFSKPKRGDVVVFNHRDFYDGTRKDFIKRLIGLPGDHIQMRNGVLYINNTAVKREALPDISNYDITGEYGSINCYKETLTPSLSYRTLDIDKSMKGNNTIEFVVPEHHYFMMGDNRDDSEDSRFSLGYIPEDELLGKADIIFFSLSDGVSGFEIWKWFNHIRWNRLFSSIN